VESLLTALGCGDDLLEQPAVAHVGLVTATARPQPTWVPGSTFGHYVILERLGAGGMGEVFRAHDTLLDRDVALKTLTPDLSRDSSYLERLRREARLLASVNHPNVATLHEIAEAAGRLALVMELIEGETLAKRLLRSRPRIGEILTVATQIADALEAAHRRGVVHRDLKPGNIMMARGGLIKVLDFGLARSGFGPRCAGATGYAGEALTSAGAVLGTAGYMAPEQADGRDADGRSDIFSFGAILYEMAAGCPAFDGETPAQRVSSILRDEPPPFENQAPDIPKNLLRLICRCLRKDPDERYQNITDVKFTIHEIKEDLGQGDARKAMPAITRRRVLAGSAFAAGCAALSYVSLRFRGDGRSPTIVTPVTMHDGLAQTPVLSPDGKMVAFMWDGEHEDNFDIYLKVIGSGDSLRLTANPRAEVFPLWSPDGRFIAFSRTQAGPAPGGSETISVIPVLGGPERTVGTGFANDWSPDGSMFLALVASEGQPTSWHLVSAADGSRRRLITTPRGTTMGRGRFSPDGRKMYYIEQTEPAESRLNELSLTGEEPKRVPIAGLRSIDSFAWAGPSELVLAGRTFQSAAPRFYRVPASGGVPEPLPFGTNGSSVDTFPGARSLVYSYDEFRENIWRVGAWPGSDRQPHKWVASDAPTMNPAVSPAGDRIAFASSRSGIWTIWISDADGSSVAPAVRFPEGATHMIGSPTWSPDGSQIAFDVHIGNYPNIFVAAIGSGEPRRLTDGNGRNMVPAWSPDGQWIYYTSSATGTETIWRAPAAGGEPRQVTRRGGYACKVSPDGKYLYYLKSSRQGELWCASVETGEERLLLRELKNRNFWILADGVYLLDPGVSAISPFSRGRARFYRFRTRRIEDLGFETEKPIDHYGISLSPDGKWLYYTQADRNSSNIMLVENFR
jgi:Tol biopolymer transport system component